jgi:hypothetical protein
MIKLLYALYTQEIDKQSSIQLCIGCEMILY